MKPFSPTLRFPRESLKPPGSLPLRIIDLGLIDFSQGWEFQQQTLQAVIQGRLPDTLILCEHPSIITLGRLAKIENILVSDEQLKDKGIKVLRINRAGEVTLHGPGQLVAYPIFNLRWHGRDVHHFLRKLEEVVIDFLKYFAINGIRKPGLSGVWVNHYKIASVGVGIKHWVSFHGLAVNVDMDIENFALIRPCGLDIQMTSLKECTGREIDMGLVKERMAQCFVKVFNLRGGTGNDQCVSAGIGRGD